MKRRTEETPIARVFEDVGGFYVCDDAAPILDARGKPYGTKAAAMEGAARDGYRFATGSGTYWGNEVKAIPEPIRARARA